MSLVQQTQAALATLACPSSSQQRLAASSSNQQFECDFSALDSLGCSFTLFELHSDQLSTADITALKKVAENLSARLTYLLEAIRPIEVDPDQCVVQMRSVPPSQVDNRTTYYELLVRKGGYLSLCRFARDPGQPREQIAAHVTREVFWRLLSDFSAAA